MDEKNLLKCHKCKIGFPAEYKGDACSKCLGPIDRKPAKEEAEKGKESGGKKRLPLENYHTIDPKVGWIPHNTEQLEIKLILEDKDLKKLYVANLEYQMKIEKRTMQEKVKAIREAEGKEAEKKGEEPKTEDEFTDDDYGTPVK